MNTWIIILVVLGLIVAPVMALRYKGPQKNRAEVIESWQRARQKRNCVAQKIWRDHAVEILKRKDGYVVLHAICGKVGKTVDIYQSEVVSLAEAQRRKEGIYQQIVDGTCDINPEDY